MYFSVLHLYDLVYFIYTKISWKKYWKLQSLDWFQVGSVDEELEYWNNRFFVNNQKQKRHISVNHLFASFPTPYYTHS